MIKKLNKTDFIFIITLFAGLLLHFLFTLVPHFLIEDEAFYASIPLRLVNGDSLMQSEWHLSQFSSIFSYLPVLIWKTLKGTTDGLILFLRYVYLAIHTSIAVVIYKFFRKYEKWAIVAAMMFYMQVSYKIYAISYNSMLAIFLLLFTFCLFAIHKKATLKLYIFAGFSYGACCICNPILCIIFPLYIIACVLWRYKDNFAKKKTAIKKRLKEKKIETTSKKKSPKYKTARSAAEYPYAESFNCFFCKKAFFYSFSGICIIAVISIIFFFSTGGTISSVFQNIGNLLQSSEYDIVSNAAFSKFTAIWASFNRISMKMPYLLPILFTIVFFDKNKKKNTHKVTYLILSIIISIVYIIGIFREINFKDCILSLPFAIFSVMCYILTENKNKPIFYCMWCPCIVVTIINLFTANTLFSSAGVVLAIGNVAGVIFVYDFFKELSFVPTQNIRINKKILAACRSIICIGLCLQLLVYIYAMQYRQLPQLDCVQASFGPWAGMLMSENQYADYEACIADLDIIKEQSNENDPVLIVSFQTWMYLYVQRPIATFTTWYEGEIKTDSLIEYYKLNVEKIPKYIYVVNSVDETLESLSEMFVFTITNLNRGILLSVKSCKIN